MPCWCRVGVASGRILLLCVQLEEMRSRLSSALIFILLAAGSCQEAVGSAGLSCSDTSSCGEGFFSANGILKPVAVEQIAGDAENLDYKHLLLQRKPVLIRQDRTVAGWPAMKYWTPERIAQQPADPARLHLCPQQQVYDLPRR